MNTLDLYLVFLVIGALLFSCIYVYSKIQIKNNRKALADNIANESVGKKDLNTPDIEERSVSGSVSVGGVTATVSSNSPIKSKARVESVSDVVPQVDSAPLDQIAQELVQTNQDFSLEDDIYDNENYSEQRIVESSSSVNMSVSLNESSAIQVENDTVQRQQGDLLAKQASRDSEFNDTHVQSKPQQHSPKQELQKESSKAAYEMVASILGENAVPRDEILSVYRNFDYLFTRKVGIFGRNSLTAVWEDVEKSDASIEFLDIALAIQLADKTGAMTRKESNTFSTMVLELGEKLNRKIVFSMDIDDAIERGRELDEIARRYDATVVCNIVPKRKQGFSSIDIKSCTRDLNMIQARNGVFSRFGEVGGVATLRYSLAVAADSGKYVSVTQGNSFHVKDIILFVKVPLVQEPEKAFDLMMEDAYRLAAWLDGKVVDKHGRNMTSRTKESLSGLIAGIEQEMASEGLVSGSELCRKLF